MATLPPRDTKSLQEYWESYLEQVVPSNASSVQIDGTRKAFYAGAASMLTIMTVISEAATEEASDAAMESLLGELQQFGRSIQ